MLIVLDRQATRHHRRLRSADPPGPLDDPVDRASRDLADLRRAWPTSAPMAYIVWPWALAIMQNLYIAGGYFAGRVCSSSARRAAPLPLASRR